MKAPVTRRTLVVAIASLAILSMPVRSFAALKYFHVLINGPQETPPNASTATGIGLLTYDTATSTLCFSITHSAAGEILAHIHGPAVPGVPAGIILALPVGPTKAGCVVSPALPFAKADLFKNLYYVNIHTGAFPGGEIRGQILRIK